MVELCLCLRTRDEIKKMKKYLDNLNLSQVLGIALIVRLIAAIFSQGWGMHDDHYLVVEVAGAWAKGVDVANWFVSDFSVNTSGRSIFYPGIHYAIFSFLKSIGLESPTGQMYIVRIIHALYSLLVVFYGYKLTLLAVDNKKIAIRVALILSLLWCMPWISIRTFAEFVSVPPMMGASYLTLKAIKEKNIRWWTFIKVGILLSIAFSIRYQSGAFSIGFVVGLLIWKQYRAALIVIVAALAWFLPVHGLGDYYATTIPFGKIIFYIKYNLEFAGDYITQPWYQYLFVVPVFLVPPVGVFLFYGTFKKFKEGGPAIMGVIFFFVLHSILKGKQERFMFTILPFFIVYGYLGWLDVREKIKTIKWQKIEKGVWTFCIVINFIALPFITTWYSKKARVESMAWFYGKSDVSGVIVANDTRGSVASSPRFYSNQLFPIFRYQNKLNFEKFCDSMQKKSPNYILLEKKPGEETVERSKKWAKELNASLEFKTEILGSWIDRAHYKLNKIVKNDEYDIYRIIRTIDKE